MNSQELLYQNLLKVFFNKKKWIKIIKENLMESLQKKLWGTEQEILDVFHDVCEKNNLKYSLAFGTLIGAVRHKGFIPWDDDIDVFMPRDDYEILLKIWEDIAPKEYILQTPYNEKDYTNNFAKIRKNHTTFIQTESEYEKKYHKGIFIDVFPGDRVASSRWERKIQYCACAINLLYTKGFTSGSTGITGKIEKFLLSTKKTNYPTRRDKAEKIMRLWNKKKQNMFFFPNVISWCNNFYHPADMFDNLIKVEFNGKFYFAVADYDKILRLEYGNYMEFPPEEERVWKHHPILIDFENNYEELNLIRLE